MLIGYVLIALLAICAYIYMGLILADKMPLDTIQYYLFWAAYAIFGLSIATILFLGKAWQILQAKRGPVGPRGYRGDTGHMGQTGECFSEQYIIAIKKEALSDIANTLIAAGIVQQHEQVYDTARLRLVNRYLDMRFQRQIDSPQLHSLMESGIKTIAQVASYISGLWSNWTHGLVTAATKAGNPDAVAALFTQPTATPGQDASLDTYITNEASRSDVWNWGHPAVIQPAVVRVRPYKKDYESQSISSNGTGTGTDNKQNLDKPHPAAPLKFHVVKYSDLDLSAMQPEPMWTSTGYPDADPLLPHLFTNLSQNQHKQQQQQQRQQRQQQQQQQQQKHHKWWSPSQRGILGTIRRPALYMPKSWVDPDTNERYYPLGPVMVEMEPKLRSTVVRECLLVSGDVVIPNVVSQKPLWHDTTGRTNQGAFFSLDTDQPGYTMLTTLWPVTGRKNYNPKAIRQQLGSMDPRTGLVRDPSKWRGPVAVPTSFLASTPLQDITPTQDMDIWVYQPPPLPRKGAARTKYLLKYSAPSKETVALFSHNSTGIAIIVPTTSNNSSNHVGGSDSDKIWNFQDWVLRMGMPGKHIMEEAPMVVTNEQTDNLGLAWYGEPQRDSKYSIFAFLGIVPEGQIQHSSSNRVFRFRHYGGPEPELYNILVTTPTFWHIRKQDNRAYMLASTPADTSGSQIQFISPDKPPENSSVVQWRILAVDPVSKRIGPLDVSRYRDSLEEQHSKQYIVLESVGRPGHVIAIKSKANLKINRWSRGNRGPASVSASAPASSTSTNSGLAGRRPAEINLDGVYLEWHLLNNITQAGDMSIFILEPAA